jgi:hypothetical protein
MSVLIIGNGFDRNLGFPTGYGNFIESEQFRSITQNNIAERLKREKRLHNWIDIENEFQKYSDEFNIPQGPNKVKNLRGIPKVKVKEWYLEIVNALIDYLNTIDYTKYDRNSEAFKLLQKINGGSVIYDFNYTPTVSLILDELGHKVVHEEDTFGYNNNSVGHIKVHGRLEDRNIVFGVSDDCTIYGEHNFFKKASNKNYPAVNFDTVLQQEDDIIYLFGHSLGNMDYHYFQPFFNYILNQHPKRESGGYTTQLYLYYKGESDWDDINDRLIELSQNRLTDFKRNIQFQPIECQ